MPEQKRVTIVHADGREYSILPRDFDRATVHPRGVGSYADQGFRIVAHEDGSPYEGPKTKREIEQAAEQRLTARTDSKPAQRAEGKGRAG